PPSVASVSTWPKHAQERDSQNRARTVPFAAPAIGGGGVSTISSAAARKASSSLRVDGLYRRETAALERLTISPAMARVGRIFRKCATKSLCGRPREPPQ